MIITQKKPIEEVMAMVGDAKTVAIIGCGSCATACQTGGEAQIAELTTVLEQAGKKVVATTVADYCCMSLGVRGKMKPLVAAKPDCVITMSCGDGVQCVAKNAGNIPVYPSNNTMYLGEAVRFGVWEEACHLCGDCVLGQTGAVCPITQCAKSLVNGPCGGQKNGKCEVNPENDCAWIKIYKRLEATGQLEKLTETREDKGYSKVSYPRTISLRGKK
ncbi:MAG: methylenetetrahydrofolate reductase C-terminal domain-containing protein [Firmicutes bacterium]|nr:methylenetetrahydrofolate reductase C-terminal domain-containing protein [Bacillota bacterium]